MNTMTIGRLTSNQYGIPKGLPHLTGFVMHCEIARSPFSHQSFPAS